MSEDPRVLVTGASGYIAAHVVQQLLQDGYKVRGTVRSLNNEEKTQPLKELCPDSKHPLELVEAELTDEECWTEAVKGCTYVLHVATPVSSRNPKHEDEIIRPAVDGTLAILKACARVGTVKRVVVTSSTNAVNGMAGSGSFSEKDWPDTTQPLASYPKSKALAEKAAWDFVKELPEEEQFELVTVLPGTVMGPVLSGTLAASMEYIQRLMERKIPALPYIGSPMVDVRDVASAHIKAMIIPEAANNRHIVTSDEFLWFKDIATILDTEFRPLGYNVSTWQAPYFLVKFASFFDKSLGLILPAWGNEYKVDNNRMKHVLGVTTRPIKESIIEMAYSMIEKGFIQKPNKYKNSHDDNENKQ